MAGRSFNPESATDESLALIAHLKTFGVEQWTMHTDLHETTDTDKTEFTPAKAARDGKGSMIDVIPDGFYLVARADMHATTKGWLTAMTDAVKQVTHLAPPEDNGKLMDEELIQDAVIGIPDFKLIGLCAGVTNAPLATVTEVYPDSPKATDEQCNDA